MTGLDAFSDADIERYVAEATEKRVKEAATAGYALEEELPPAVTEEIPDGPYFSPGMDGPDPSKMTYAARTDASARRMDF